MHLQKNADGCLVKKVILFFSFSFNLIERNRYDCMFCFQNPRLFPFHVYWNTVNKLSVTVLYFPYLIFGIALLLVLLERLLTRFKPTPLNHREQDWVGLALDKLSDTVLLSCKSDRSSLRYHAPPQVQDLPLFTQCCNSQSGSLSQYHLNHCMLVSLHALPGFSGQDNGLRNSINFS